MAARAVLVAEDNPDDVELIVRALRKVMPSIEIVVVNDGVEVLDYLQRSGEFADHDPDERLMMVLLDLGLPRLDGLNVLVRKRQDIENRLIPVVIFTASDDQQSASYDLGANSYIRKPNDGKAFTETIERVMRYWLTLNEPAPRRGSETRNFGR